MHSHEDPDPDPLLLTGPRYSLKFLGKILTYKPFAIA